MRGIFTKKSTVVWRGSILTKLTRHKLSDLYTLASGISSSKDQAGHGQPFLSFSTAFNNVFLPAKLPDLMASNEKEQEKHSIKCGDVFLTRTSEVVDELAISSVAVKDYPSATFSGFLKRLRPKESDKAYPKYMALYLRSQLFRKAMDNNAVMTLRASFNEAIFSYLDVWLPDYDKQVEIGDLLYAIEKKITLNNKINAELDAMARLIYDYWFIQFDFPDENGNPYKSSGGKMGWCDQLKREIPEGWDTGVLSDFGKIIGGSTPSKENDANFAPEGIPWITPNDLSNNVGNNFISRGQTDVSEAGLKAASLKLLPAGAVLLSSRAPIGYMAIARNPVSTNQGFKSFVPTDRFPTAFIFFAVKCLMPSILRNANGSTFKEISGGTLGFVKTSLPDEAVVKEFCKKLQPVLGVQDALETQNQELANLRDWLLPMLMNGQVSVGE